MSQMPVVPAAAQPSTLLLACTAWLAVATAAFGGYWAMVLHMA